MAWPKNFHLRPSIFSPGHTSQYAAIYGLLSGTHEVKTSNIVVGTCLYVYTRDL